MISGYLGYSFSCTYSSFCLAHVISAKLIPCSIAFFPHPQPHESSFHLPQVSKAPTVYSSPGISSSLLLLSIQELHKPQKASEFPAFLLQSSNLLHQARIVMRQPQKQQRQIILWATKEEQRTIWGVFTLQAHLMDLLPEKLRRNPSLIYFPVFPN